MFRNRRDRTDVDNTVAVEKIMPGCIGIFCEDGFILDRFSTYAHRLDRIRIYANWLIGDRAVLGD